MNGVNNRCNYGPSFGNVKVLEEGLKNGPKALRLGPINYLNLTDHFEGTIKALNNEPLVQKKDIVLGSVAGENPFAGDYNTIVAYDRVGDKLKEIVRVNPGSAGDATPVSTSGAIDRLRDGIMKFVGAKK